MKHQKTLLTLALIACATVTGTAQAQLTVGTAADQSVVYSSISNVTWTGDANLLGTLEASNPNLVNTIISTIGSITDIPLFPEAPYLNGIYTLSTADFGANGLVSWFGAQAYTKYLNTINYAGSNQWALPSTGVNPQYGFNQTGTQFGQLYYNELNALAGLPGTTGSNFGILGDGTNGTSGITGPFANAQTDYYWLGLFTPDPATYPLSIFFDASNGNQDINVNPNYSLSYVWAVSPNTIAGFTPSAVPVPGAVWLFGSGLMSLLGFKRRNSV
jgi:hypothetical protein